MKNPADCKNIEEVRAIIDDIDKAIINLLGERQNCVKEIVRFKKTSDEVVAKTRQQTLYAERRAWAESNGLSADLIENMYKMLVEHNIQHELSLIKKEI